MDTGADSDFPSPMPGQVTDATGAPPPEAAESAGVLGPVPAEAGRPVPPGRPAAGGHRAGYYKGRSARRERGPFYAALDLGTNNCRLLIAEPVGEAFRVVDSFSRIVRLGEGMAQSGRLAETAMERSIAALRVCAQKLDIRPMARVRLIATQACRVAENGADIPRPRGARDRPAA